MIRIFILFFALFVSQPAFSQTKQANNKIPSFPGFTIVNGIVNERLFVYVKTGSGRFTEISGSNIKIYVATFMYLSKGTISYGQSGVTLALCSAGQGLMLSYKLNNEFDSTSEVVIGGPRIGDLMASLLCAAASYANNGSNHTDMSNTQNSV